MKVYLAAGVLICGLFFAAGARGFLIESLFNSPTHGPVGHSHYHK